MVTIMEQLEAIFTCKSLSTVIVQANEWKILHIFDEKYLTLNLENKTLLEQSHEWKQWHPDR